MSDDKLVKCPNCGKMVKDSKLCSKCGADLHKGSRISSKAIIAAVVVVAILAVAVFASGILTPQDDEPVLVSQDPDNDAEVSNATAEYWASAKAEKFHLPTCEWAQKISDSNKIVYSSRDDAIADGKVPCGACNP